MILIETVLVIISYIQYGINGAYTVITAGMVKDNNRLSIENFVATLSNLMRYLYFSINCFSFRAVVKRLFYCQQAINQRIDVRIILRFILYLFTQCLLILVLTIIKKDVDNLIKIFFK